MGGARASGITIYEYESLAEAAPGGAGSEGVHAVPARVVAWLEDQCLRASAQGEAAWLRLAQRRGRRVVQVTRFVGVIRAPDGFQIEVLPKVGRAIGGGSVEARQLLIDMLGSLPGFRHVRTASARIMAARMPLQEVFVAEYLRSVEYVVKRGLRSGYSLRQDNLPALRGKLLVGPHLRQNLFRADRFLTEHDEFGADRAENRLLHAALRRVLALSASRAHQQLARELTFAFADVPISVQPRTDFQLVPPDRGTRYYEDALAWARLILNGQAPLTGTGENSAPSLLFPMDAVFEAFVAEHLVKQVVRPLSLKMQARTHYLVHHRTERWFRLKPDLLVQDAGRNLLVLDSKWKLLDVQKANGTDKYGLAQGDFYQLLAYGQSYLEGQGDVILVYPRTASFNQPLPAFDFLQPDGLRLWVLPFCLKARQLAIPANAPFADAFERRSLTEEGTVADVGPAPPTRD